MSGISVCPLPTDIGAFSFDALKPYLLEASNRHPYDLWDDDEQRRMVAEGRLMLISIHDGLEMKACAAVEMIEGTDGKTLHVRYLTGEDVDDWLDELVDGLRQIASAYDCVWLGLAGRLGWRKKLARLGWSPVALHMRARVVQ